MVTMPASPNTVAIENRYDAKLVSRGISQTNVREHSHKIYILKYQKIIKNVFFGKEGSVI